MIIAIEPWRRLYVAFISLIAACLLQACGGSAPDTAREISAHKLSTLTNGQHVVTFSGLRDDYTIIQSNYGYLVTNNVTGASQTVLGSERLRFADLTLSFDSVGTPGKIFRLYQAAFKRSPDLAGLGYWIDAADNGVSFGDVAAGFVNSNEFKLAFQYDNDGTSIASQFYNNVLNRPGEAAGMQYWSAILDAQPGNTTIASVLMGFSESQENINAVAPTLAQGIAYIEPDIVYPQALGGGPSTFQAVGDPNHYDYVGQGRTSNFDQTNAIFSVKVTGAYINVKVAGNETWSGGFATGNVSGLVAVSTYASGATFAAGSRGCSSMGAPYTIDKVSYINGQLARLDVHFGDVCSPDVGPSGVLHWNANDPTVPAEPTAIPANLWQPASIPATNGNYLVLESPPGDFVGVGRNYSYTDSAISVSAFQATLGIGAGDQKDSWTGNFQVMLGQRKFVVGYYPGLERYPFNNPAKGGLDWYGDSRGCNTSLGWVAIDQVTYINDHLKSIDLRFEQSCDGMPPLHGKLHWMFTQVSPVDGLWQPPAGWNAPSGNYVYLESHDGVTVQQSATFLDSSANSLFDVSATGRALTINVTGEYTLSGLFDTLSDTGQLQPGYHSAAVDSLMQWAMDSEGCSNATGYFVIDSVSYSNNALNSVDLRFEEQCGPGSPTVYGKIHWMAGVSVNYEPTPPPQGLWTPPTGVLPVTGNYVYLESLPGDYIGGGHTYIYTAANALLPATYTNQLLTVEAPDKRQYPGWSIQFHPMDNLSQIAPGYYGDLKRYPFYNPTMGGFSVFGSARACNKSQSWVVVDDITYTGNTLTKIDFRFEQNCDLSTSPLHGAVRWQANSN